MDEKKEYLALEEILQGSPPLTELLLPLTTLHKELARVFESGGTLYIAGNGGSAADAQHIAGELMKSFTGRRSLSAEQRMAFAGSPSAEEVADCLENGLPVLALGLNHSLVSAIGNDFDRPHIEFAQELWVLGREGDAFLGISTSGRAENILNAVAVAQAKGLFTSALTGKAPNPLSQVVDLSLAVSSSVTSQIQQMHQILYHALCAALEARFFGRP
jgi:D-sedoheptulose 7-phosphate isomerase